MPRTHAAGRLLWVIFEREPMVNRVHAIEHTRCMRGGSQSHLMRCSDGEYYVVKFQDNPQGTKVLANELLGTLLAKELGLPVAEMALVEVSEELIQNTEAMVVELGRSLTPCSPGWCFGSRYPSTVDSSGRTVLRTVYGLLPDAWCLSIDNVGDFAGMLVFDKWTANCDGRQVIYVQTEESQRWRTIMIDNGFCFGGSEWNFSSATVRGVFAQPYAYRNVKGLRTFEPWLKRLEDKIDRSLLLQFAREVPLEWYGGDAQAITSLMDELDLRRQSVTRVLLSTWHAAPMSFPNWIYKRPKFSINFYTRRPAGARTKAEGA